MKTVGVVDYGAGNLGSVLRALEALEAQPFVIHTPQDFVRAGHVIFPGVGAAGQAMAALKKSGLEESLRKHVRAGKPLLGICVGMQLLGLHSEEDDTACLGLMPFELRKFRTHLPVPHMGWNDLVFQSENAQCSLAFQSLKSASSDVYFVHSYFAPMQEKSLPYVLSTTKYGDVEFVSSVAVDNLWGFQFHVEKSGKVGLQLLKNFWEAF
jgi:imidazole glycerol-phosphate synthase subunit HisH